jgi:hypothetical protein
MFSRFHFEFITNPIRPTWVVQFSGQVLAKPQPMIGLPQQKQPRIGRDPLVGRLHLDSPIELGFE